MNDKYNLWKNKHRYIDKDTIEVKIDDEKTFFIDTKNLDKIKGLKIQAVNKSGTDNWYVKYQIKKDRKNVASLFTNYSTIKYIDKNPFNLREKNLMGQGQGIVKTKSFVENKYKYSNELDHYEIIQQYNRISNKEKYHGKYQ